MTASPGGVTFAVDGFVTTGLDATDDATLEFRVLAGPHAGARFTWPSAADAILVVGAHAE